MPLAEFEPTMPASKAALGPRPTRRDLRDLSGLILYENFIFSHISLYPLFVSFYVL